MFRVNIYIYIYIYSSIFPVSRRLCGLDMCTYSVFLNFFFRVIEFERAINHIARPARRSWRVQLRRSRFLIARRKVSPCRDRVENITERLNRTLKKISCLK